MKVKRCKLKIEPSPIRVLIRPFIPGEERIKLILMRILSLSPKQVHSELKRIKKEFSAKAFKIEDLLIDHYERIKHHIPQDRFLQLEQKLLIGAYFTHEYSLESTALCNPSIVPHYDQSGVGDGELKFILSLRAIGEGHISSIVFREGIITRDHQIVLFPPNPIVAEPRKVSDPIIVKSLFIRKLAELGAWNQVSRLILEPLEENFSLSTLMSHAIRVTRENIHLDYSQGTLDVIRTLAHNNYEVYFPENQPISSRVIFPSSPSEMNGIEDARFVVLTEEGGHKKYYATYTAYDGKVILPQLLETDNFNNFKFITLNGNAAKNKGMALFPRKINGQYVMLSRHDNENLYVVFSENVHFWYDPIKIMQPSFPWEFVQIGNCGSPIEIDEGWLVLTHGVGPMRKYCISAFLLDKNNPTRVIGRLSDPILKPEGDEKEGYVPNVVYTCGAIVHNKRLVIPYAMSDYATKFATLDLKDLLNEMS